MHLGPVDISRIVTLFLCLMTFAVAEDIYDFM